MAGFADLVKYAQPALWGGGFAVEATEGRDWEWNVVDITDDTGAAIDLSTGVTTSCQIWDAETGALLTTLAFAGTALGTFKLTKAAASTGNLAASQSLRRCVWSLEVTKGGIQVQWWSPQNSEFLIRDEDWTAA